MLIDALDALLDALHDGVDIHVQTTRRRTPRIHFTLGPFMESTYVPAPAPAGTGASTPPTEGLFTVQLTTDQQVTISVSGRDRGGNPVTIPGTLVWELSDLTLATLEEGADPNARTIVPVGTVGAVTVTVHNDKDDDGDDDFQGSLAVDIVEGEVREITLDTSEPTPIPDEPTA